MNWSASTRAIVVVFCVALIAPPCSAQWAGRLPPTYADSLLADGRWTEAEAAFYRQAEAAPRNPIARAALGRFIAMKGAVRPGMVLIGEARKFGLDRGTTDQLMTALRAIMDWRTASAGLTKDFVLDVRPPNNSRALFQIALPRTDDEGQPLTKRNVSEVIWYDVVDRQIGLDSLNTPSRPMGIEVFEALVPSVDVQNGEVTLHANPRSALAAKGRRFQVLRTPREVQVLIAEGRVVSLPTALRELQPTWWQIDLPHGVLVVR